MKVLSFTALLVVLVASTVGAQQGDSFREDVETRFLGAGKNSAAFMGKVYGTTPKLQTTLWTFHKAPAQSGGVPYNTVASAAEIDCSARTMKRTSAMLLHGEAFGPDQKSRVIRRQTVKEAAQPYAGGTLFHTFIETACGPNAPDDKKHPVFKTLTQARTFATYALGK